MLLFSLLLLCAILGQNVTLEPCVYTQYGWTQMVCEIDLSDSTCGEAWCDLMQVDVAGMKVLANQQWMLVLHQFVTASLNRRTLQSPLNFTAVDAALLLVADALERNCANYSAFYVDPASLWLLYAFNHGLVTGAPACGDEFTWSGNASDTTGMRGDEFYYYNPPDIIALRNSVTNTTQETSVLRGLYNQETFLLVCCVVEAVAIIVLGLRLLIARNLERDYKWSLERIGRSVGVTTLNDDATMTEDGSGATELKVMSSKTQKKQRV
jgi:hypothetical protein